MFSEIDQNDFSCKYWMQDRHNNDYVCLYVDGICEYNFPEIIWKCLTLRESINIKKHCKEVCQSGA